MAFRHFAAYLLAATFVSTLDASICDAGDEKPLKVSLELRVITVTESMWERLTSPAGEGENAEPVFTDNAGVKHAVTVERPTRSRPGGLLQGGNAVVSISPERLATLLDALQVDRRFQVSAIAPIVVQSGEKSHTETGEKQTFVTGLEVKETNGNGFVLGPHNEEFLLGYTIDCQPKVSADRRSVQLPLKFGALALLSETIPVTSVQIPIPNADTNSKTAPTVFQVNMQKPRFDKWTVESTINVPDGRSIVYGSRKVTKRVESKSAPSKIPYLDRLFTSATVVTEEQVVEFLIVTPRIVIEEEVEELFIAPNSRAVPRP